jgi:secreted protein with Ig-like and vWFA domain
MKTPPEPTAAQQSTARLTAWALAELPASSPSDFESKLLADPDLKTEAEALRDFCNVLGAELSSTLPSGALELPAAARRQLEMAAGTPAPRRTLLWLLPLSVAACFAFLLIGHRAATGKTAEKQQAERTAKIAEAETRVRAALSVENAKNPDPPKPSPNLAVNQSEEVRRLYKMGEGYFDLGEFQNAEEHFNKVLALDPTNPAARRALEKTAREVNNYYQAANDHTRLKMLNDVDSLWVTPLPGIQGSESKNDSAPSLQKQEVADWEPHPDQFSDLNRPVYPPGLQVAEKNLPDSTSSAATYRGLPENSFVTVKNQPLSTFSIDVDTASYAIARRYLYQGERPPVASVRLEEMINYFPMDDAAPVDGKPFALHVESASAPWQTEHRLVRVALKGRAMPAGERPAARLVFLVDTSGSMEQSNKLPLVQQTLQLLLAQLAPADHVALVTYAGESRVVLPSTPVSERSVISAAIDSLSSGGGTNGSGGINAAYELARSSFLPAGVNRVILATDGDFNVGVTDEAELKSLITREAKSGVYLSVLGFGSDNLKDTTAELLADAGNGNYAYIDSLSEARRALVTQLQGTLTTIARDVKIQVEFNPAQVASYRLLGYENRALANQDFNDDTRDAGEIGAGHSVTALYEIVPAGPAAPSLPATDPLKYQANPPALPAPANLTPQATTGELLTVKVRYQLPEGKAPSQLIEVALKDSGNTWEQVSANFRWTAAVAGYALLLANSQHAPSLTWDTVRTLAGGAKGPDPEGFRGEFLQLIGKAAGVAPGPAHQ